MFMHLSKLVEWIQHSLIQIWKGRQVSSFLLFLGLYEVTKERPRKSGKTAWKRQLLSWIQERTFLKSSQMILIWILRSTSIGIWKLLKFETYCYCIQDLKIKRELSSADHQRNIHISGGPEWGTCKWLPVWLKGRGQYDSSLMFLSLWYKQRRHLPWQWGPPITQSLGAVSDRSIYNPHTWPPATYSDECVDHLEFLSVFQKPGISENLNAKSQPPEKGMKMPNYLLAILPPWFPVPAHLAAFSMCPKQTPWKWGLGFSRKIASKPQTSTSHVSPIKSCPQEHLARTPKITSPCFITAHTVSYRRR